MACAACRAVTVPSAMRADLVLKARGSIRSYTDVLLPTPQGYVAVDLGIKFPGAKYAALTSYTAHEATAQKELFFALLLVGTAETIGFTQVRH